jgi:hypothetical protein
MLAQTIKPLLDSELSCIFILSEKPAVSTEDVAISSDNRNAVLTLLLDDLLVRQMMRPKREIASLVKAPAGEPGRAEIVSEVNDAEKMELISAFQRDKSDFIVGGGYGDCANGSSV